MKKILCGLLFLSVTATAATVNLTNDTVMVKEPTSDNHVASKHYVDAAASGFVPGSTVDLGGGILTNGSALHSTNVIAQVITLNGVSITNWTSGVDTTFTNWISGDTEIVVTGDPRSGSNTLSIASAIARDSEVSTATGLVYTAAVQDGSNAALSGVAASYLPLAGGATKPMSGALYMGSNELVNIFNSRHYSAAYSVDDGRYEDDGGRIKWGSGEVYIRGGTVGPWMEMAFGVYGADCFKFVANPTWYLDMLTYPITNAGVISATAFIENGTSLASKYASISTTVTNSGATINGSPITNGAAITITGGSGGGISNVVVNSKAGVLSGDPSNVVATVTLVAADIGAVSNNAAGIAAAGGVTNGQVWTAAQYPLAITNNQNNVSLGTNVYLAGNVGIGTNKPAAKLHVGDGLTFSQANGIMFGDGDSGIAEYADDSFYVYMANSPRWTWTANTFSAAAYDGACVVGSAEPTSTTSSLRPKNSDSDTGIGWAGTNSLSLIAGGVSCVVLTNGGAIVNGSVGIGTNTPQAKLHVVGSAQVDTNLTVAGTITEGGTSLSAKYAPISVTIPAASNAALAGVAASYVPQTRTITINGVSGTLTSNLSWTVSGGTGDLTKAVADITYQPLASTYWTTNTLSVTNSLDFAITGLAANRIALDDIRMYLSTDSNALVSKRAMLGLYRNSNRRGSDMVYLDTNQLYYSAMSIADDAAGTSTSTVSDASGIVIPDLYYKSIGTTSAWQRASNASSTVVTWWDTNLYSMASNTLISHVNQFGGFPYYDATGASTMWFRLSFTTAFTGTVHTVLNYGR